MKNSILDVSITYRDIAYVFSKLNVQYLTNKQVARLNNQKSLFKYYEMKLDELEFACNIFSSDPEFLTACGFPPPQTNHENPAHYSNLNISKGAQHG